MTKKKNLLNLNNAEKCNNWKIKIRFCFPDWPHDVSGALWVDSPTAESQVLLEAGFYLALKHFKKNRFEIKIKL